MDEREFRRVIDFFPIVRSRNYCAESESSRGSTSRSQQDEVTEWKDAWNNMDDKDASAEPMGEDSFWEKLRLAAEKKVGRAQAEQFCKAFQIAHEKLVYEELSLETARKFITE